METILNVFGSKTVVWITRQGISTSLIEHWGGGKTLEETKILVEQVYKDRGYLKLIDGTERRNLKNPWATLLSESSDIIVKALEPDIWQEVEENNMPDFMRVERFGIYDWKRLAEVHDRFKIKGMIRHEEVQY